MFMLERYENYQDWLNSLSEGNVVCYNSSAYGVYYRTCEIEKITPKRKFRVDGILFNENGCHRIDLYHSYSLEPYTDKIKNKIEYDKAYSYVLNEFKNLPKLSFVQIKAIKTIMEDE